VQGDYTLVALYKEHRKNLDKRNINDKSNLVGGTKKRKLKEEVLYIYLEVTIRTEAPFEAREYAKWKSKLVFPLCSGP